MPKLNQEDIFFKEEKAEDSKPKKNTVPYGYIPVKLDSLGKLGYPAVLHFRDYSTEEALGLSSSDEEHNLHAMIDALNGMVHEGIDCSQLHLADLMTIVFTLQGTFWGSTIEKEYYKDTSLPKGKKEGQRDHKDNIAVAEISLASLETQVIPEDFEEPFLVKQPATDLEITFRFPRIGDLITAQNYVDKEFERETREMSSTIMKIRSIRGLDTLKEREEAYLNMPVEERLSYEKYLENKSKLFYKIAQACSIEKIGKKPMTSTKERLDNLHMVSLPMWKEYSKKVRANEFGIKSEVEFTPEGGGDPITRRFQFQIMDFLPDIPNEEDREDFVPFI